MFYKSIKILLMIVFIVALEGCQYREIKFPYIRSVNQGKFISLEQKEMLKIDMSKEQVMSILGTPAMKDIYETNRWDYIMYNKSSGKDFLFYQFTLWFNNEKLIKWHGDRTQSEQLYKIDIIKKISTND